MYHGAKRSITQNSLIILTAVDLPAANVFATVWKELLVQSLDSAIGIRFSIGIACRNWICLSLLVEQLSLYLEMCLESYGNHISNTARGFGRLACYQPRVLLLDTPRLSAVCKCSSQKGLTALQKQKIVLSADML